MNSIDVSGRQERKFLMKFFRKNDLYLIIAFIGIFALISVFLQFTKKEGSMVLVSVDGKITAAYPLSEDISVVIDGFGGGTNRLEIKGGSAYLTDTSCPDHLCEKMGKINSVGQSIICLPNRVVVEITGDYSSEYDAVVGG